MIVRRRWWLALSIVPILAFLLIWQSDLNEDAEHRYASDLGTTAVQSSRASSAAPKSTTCIQPPGNAEGDFTHVDNSLKCILSEYLIADEQKDQKKFLALDAELRELVYSAQRYRGSGAWARYWQAKIDARQRYARSLGVSIDDASLSYDGGLRYAWVRQARNEEFDQFERVKPRFDQIKAAFLAVPKTSEISNIEALYKLDEELRVLIAEAKELSLSMMPLPDYREIGVHAGEIRYNGEIALVADRLLPSQGFIDPESGKPIEIKGDRFSKLKQALESIYLDYRSLNHLPEDAEALYEMSERISKLVREIHVVYPNEQSQIFWEQKYDVLGLGIGHYSEMLEYSGKLAKDSYRLNPDSRYGEDTLAAALSGDVEAISFSGVPNTTLAETYLKKYPGGKHTAYTYGVLATFYQNLFEEMAGREASATMGECYSGHLAIHPEDRNREAVRTKAIAYYKKLLSSNQPELEEHREALNNLEKGVAGNIRYWCTD